MHNHLLYKLVYDSLLQSQQCFCVYFASRRGPFICTNSRIERRASIRPPRFMTGCAERLAGGVCFALTGTGPAAARVPAARPPAAAAARRAAAPLPGRRQLRCCTPTAASGRPGPRCPVPAPAPPRCPSRVLHHGPGSSGWGVPARPFTSDTVFAPLACHPPCWRRGGRQLPSQTASRKQSSSLPCPAVSPPNLGDAPQAHSPTLASSCPCWFITRQGKPVAHSAQYH